MRSSYAAALATCISFAVFGCGDDPVPVDSGRPDVADVIDVTVDSREVEADVGPPPIDEPPPPDVVMDVTQERDLRCTTDADCASMPGLHACDVASGRCVGCNTAPDSCPADQHCNGASRTCAAGCRSDEGCRTPTGHCIVATHRCVVCETNANCMLGSLCVMNVCVAGCDASHGCPTGQSCCAARCINTASDLGNCGGCGDVCAVPNGTPQCLDGRCGPAMCREPFGNCDGIGANGCEANLETDPTNCGMCGRRCPTRANATPICVEGNCDFVCEPNFGDCDRDAVNGCEIDTRTSASHCVVCGHACPTGVTCSAAACPFGTGTDMALNASADRTLSPSVASAEASRGAMTVALSRLSGTFARGNLVLLHQTQAPTGAVGYYEYARVASATATGLTLERPLLAAYHTDATTSRAQVVLVPEYTAVNVSSGATLTAPPWNGSTGGILAFDANDSVTVAGRISMDFRGFRGTRRTCATGAYRCMRGVQGESGRGSGRADILSNGQGGGGGGRGDHCASGGGGGHGTYGDQGFTGSGGMCAEESHPPGAPGRLGGVAGLMFSGHLGAAGGEGGGDDDGSFPGHGGNGGGAVFIRTRTLAVSGEISADGEAAGNGDNRTCSGSMGCGMGGGGGGAGGTVRLVASTSASLGSDLVHARGGDGGQCNCGAPGDFPGGVGGVGRIGVRTPTGTGSTTPTFHPG